MFKLNSKLFSSKNFPPAALFLHSNKNIIRTYNKLIGLWTIEPAIVKPICRHGFCTNTLDVYLIYQSVITILKVVFIPETKKHCYRDYFQKISIYPMVWSASTIRIFVSTEFQPRLCILTVILMRYLIERWVPETIIVPIDVANLVVARLMLEAK